MIWQESRFQPNVVGPRTRSGDRAQGIAQFMPRTAAERGLLDPFDPVQALPKSAEFLRELADQFGNLGLAAAAYNAGPGRLREFLSARRPLPAETRNYVLAITGISVDEWAASGKREPAPVAKPGCGELMALLHRAPNPFVQKLEERVNLVAVAPWGVQLSAGFSRDQALSSYATLAKRYGEVLAGRDPSLLSTILRSRGTQPFYQVRVGAEVVRALVEAGVPADAWLRRKGTVHYFLNSYIEGGSIYATSTLGMAAPYIGDSMNDNAPPPPAVRHREGGHLSMRASVSKDEGGPYRTVGRPHASRRPLRGLLSMRPRECVQPE